MTDRFAICLPHILAHEGGYVDHPKDPGGATNMGITIAALADWRDALVTKDDVRALTKPEAAAIYRARYWNPVRGDDLPPGVDLMVFDFGVNAGPGRSVRMLQRCVGAAQDGALGPRTLAAVRAWDGAGLIVALAEARLAYYRGLLTFSTFGRGWTRRVVEVRAAALEMSRVPA